MATDYSRIMYKQYMEVVERLNKMEAAHKENRSEIHGLNADIKSLQKTNAILQDKCDKLEAENTDLKEQVEDLTKENQCLKNDNERMKRILNNDSSNSSLPPSSGGSGIVTKPANTYNSRKPSSRKQGAQSGHKGKTLTKEEVEKKISEGKLKKQVKNIGNPASGNYITRYIVDLDVKAVATEVRIYADKEGKYNIPEELLRSQVIYGPNIKAMAAQLYIEGVVANDRICAFINSISGDNLEISEGSIYNFCREFSSRCVPEYKKIEEDLLNQAVLCTDATVVTLNKKQSYIRNVSSERSVVYYPAESKKIDEMSEMRVVSQFSGTFMHDHETALYNFGTKHAECNVHIGRYGVKNTQESNNSWSRHMNSFLVGMNHARKELIALGIDHFEESALQRYEARYDAILEDGYEQNKHTREKLARAEEKKLLNRMRKYKENHLLFLHDFQVPYSNNMSERDLRKCKNREKMAGGFRNTKGKEMYCLGLSVIETVKRRKQNIHASIAALFNGEPVIQ